MELDDLKNAWEDVQNQEGKQTNINLKMINEMTQAKFNNRMKSITYPEIIGTIISFIGAAYIVFNFGKLNTLFLQCTGIAVFLLLVILPVISLTFLWKFNKLGDTGKPFVETLKKFAMQKIIFYKFQKLSALFSYILLVAVILLMPPLFGTKSINDNKYFWIFAIPLGYIFLSFFSKWVLKSYRKTLEQSEELLKELNS